MFDISLSEFPKKFEYICTSKIVVSMFRNRFQRRPPPPPVGQLEPKSCSALPPLCNQIRWELCWWDQNLNLPQFVSSSLVAEGNLLLLKCFKSNSSSNQIKSNQIKSISPSSNHRIRLSLIRKNPQTNVTSSDLFALTFGFYTFQIFTLCLHTFVFWRRFGESLRLWMQPLLSPTITSGSFLSLSQHYHYDILSTLLLL